MKDSRPVRVLVVGRSPKVLVDVVDLLRERGYAANATNQFDRVLADYDVTGLDVLVFGGMVPAETKQDLRDQVRKLNPQVVFLQGLTGIAGVIAAQVQALAAGDWAGDAAADLLYDDAERTLRVTLQAPAHVTVKAWWATSFTPPEPTSSSITVFDDALTPGSHVIGIPDEVPTVASFAAVTVDDAVRVLTIGAMPDSVQRMVPTSSHETRLPSVAAVTTRADPSVAVQPR
jgi:hypothetical protein